MRLFIFLFCISSIQVFSSDATPSVKKAVAPGRYPPIAQIAKISGTVEVSVLVGVDGKVASVVSSKSSDGRQNLIPNAEMYAKRWEFSGPSNGPISITIEYRLLPQDESNFHRLQQGELGSEFISPRTIVVTGVIGYLPYYSMPNKE